MEEAVLRGRREGSEDEEGRADGEGDDGLKEVAVDDDKDAPRLFLLLSRLPDSHRAFLLTQPPLHFFTSDLLLAHAQAHLNRLLTSRNLIDFLPFEILSIIGRLAHHEARDHQFHVGSRLISVSRRWRAIFGQDEALWEEVRLTRRSASLARLESFGLRSPLRVLRIWGFGMDTKSILHALKGKLSCLEELNIHLNKNGNGTLEDLWNPFLPSVSNLHTLILSLDGRDPPFIPRLPNPLLLPSLANLRLTGIRPTDNASLWPLLEHVRQTLRSLQLDHCFLSLAPYRAGSTVSPFVVNLPQLVDLGIHSESELLDHHDETTFLLPNLEGLLLSWFDFDYHPLLFPPNNYPPNTSKLSSFGLRGELVESEPTLVLDFQQMPLLQDLDLASNDLTDATINALRVREGVEPSVPLLRKLDLEGNSMCTIEAVKRMVASREKLGWMGGGRGGLMLGDRDDGFSEASRRWLESNLAELLLYNDRR